MEAITVTGLDRACVQQRVSAPPEGNLEKKFAGKLSVGRSVPNCRAVVARSGW